MLGRLRAYIFYSSYEALPIEKSKHFFKSFKQHLKLISVYNSVYNTENVINKPLSQLHILLSKKLKISNEKCCQIVNNNLSLTTLNQEHITKILDLFEEFNVNNESVINNIHLLKIDEESLRHKFMVIKKLDLKDINDGIPLLSMSDIRLSKIIREKNTNNFAKRLYYISDTLKEPPHLIAESIVKRFFIYSMDFKQLKQSIKTLLECGVSGNNIAKDWWVMRYKDDVIKERLNMVKKTGRTKLMPWMVKCPEKVFNRSLDIASAQSKLLKNKQTSKMYLAKKLNCSMECINGMCKTFSRLPRVRAYKLEEVHDVLLKKGFTNEDIINAPKVFAHSINTILSRLEQLEKIGIKVTNLKMVCKSSKAFDKFLKSVPKYDKITQ